MFLASGYFARRRFLGMVVALFIVPGAVYFAARWAYFGDMLPATFHAKAGGAPSPFGRLHTYLPSYWDVWRYLRQNWLCLGVVALTALVGQVWRERMARIEPPGLARFRHVFAPLGLLAASLGCIAFFAAVHIEIMGYGDRFLFPYGQTLWLLVFFPPLGALSRFAAGRAWRGEVWRRSGIACACIVTFALAGCLVRTAPTWQQRWTEGRALARSSSLEDMPYREVGLALDALACQTGECLTVYHHNMGQLYYFAPHIDSIDPVGLVDRDVAVQGFTVDHVFRRNPEIMLLPSRATDRITPYEAENVPDVSAAVVSDPRMRAWRYLGYYPHLRFWGTGAMHVYARRDFLNRHPDAEAFLRERMDLRMPEAQSPERPAGIMSKESPAPI